MAALMSGLGPKRSYSCYLKSAQGQFPFSIQNVQVDKASGHDSNSKFHEVEYELIN